MDMLDSPIAQMLENIGTEVYLVDLKTLRLLDVNGAARANLGYSGDELKEMTPLDLAPDYGREELARLLAPLRDGKTDHLHVQAFHRRKDGTLYNADVHLELVEHAGAKVLAALVTDVTHQTNEHRMFEETQTLAIVGGWDMQVPSGKLSWTTEVYRIHEVPIGSPITVEEAIHFYHPDARPIIAQAVENGMRHGTPWDLELQLVTAKGRTIWVRAIGKADQRDGQVYRLAGTFQDISRRKLAEERYREQEARLAHVARLSLMGQMVAEITHELGQPLFSISSFADSCARKLEKIDHPALDKVKGWIADVVEQADRAKQIVRRYGEFVHRRDFDRQRIDVNQVIEESLHFLSSHAQREGIRVQFHRVSDLPAVHANKIQVEQVLVNLLKNAYEVLEQTPRGRRHVEVTTKQVDEEVEILVTDTGPGIAETEQHHLFDAFYTTKDDGMGMGLAISRGIIERHGGRLSVTSQPGRGATFHVTLPIDPQVEGR